jgi:hypothetical protein
MKTRFNLLIVLLALLLLSFNAYSKTITSTSKGGNWSKPETWIGAVLPTATDSVIINSTVTADLKGSVQYIKIEEKGFLFVTASRFTVTGDLNILGKLVIKDSGVMAVQGKIDRQKDSVIENNGVIEVGNSDD